MHRHEQLYRGDAAGAVLRERLITICGAGAIGSNLADNLVRQGCARLRVIDFDRVEEPNIGTQRYGRPELGALKADALQQQLFAATGVEIEAVSKRLEERTQRKLLGGSAVVVDAFDNSQSRRLVQDYCRAFGTPCLHVGLYENYGSAVWDQEYTVPRDVPGDVCEYPLARNSIMLTVAVASELLVDFLLTGTRRSRAVTLRDLRISPA